ncbi:uncharacterized protein K452DRAFT_326218 [Aplosporella prunicola CBS 121167]|uniref:SAP domain-containing protein n=1 Tax=Aplosporella prunicola CBS 121167 TaxID=1176127 RepID=A0A6A6BHF9_9PEZI|nr:uncharacterized protein K452DRAFT_326218 [Aplosporella prunicola CBS 121167]KAF2143038.1 hypothetical protein K452DRAFT_326218 [Aplosporella prunicola CBS 121167]
MASAGESLHQRALAVQPQLKQLINNDLKAICKAEGLQVSGVKAALQDRIITHLSHLVHNRDAARLDGVIARIHNKGASPPRQLAPAPVSAYPDSASPVSAPTGLAPGPHPNQAYAMPSRPRQPLFPQRFQFKDSPFYEILECIAPTIELQILPSNRSSTQSSFVLSQEHAELLRSDPGLRVMLFSAADPLLGPYARADIAFPSQLEVKLNGEEVKSNFKGLKNKPGSTRPADITDPIRKIANYKNIIQVTYALTQKARKYIFVVNLVRKHSVEELAMRISGRRVLTKESVLAEMASRANDDDIVVGSSVMSLKDPVSYVRISLPCRSSVCTHNQCFDATFFLQLQEQAPTWQCPCCNKTISYEALAVDQYVQDILQKTSSSVEKVTIEPDGKWTPGDRVESQTRNGTSDNGAGDDSDDDDLVEISDYRVANLKQEQSQTPVSGAHTPPGSSREQSAAAAPATNSRSKRKSEVIDLTLSDDDEPPRPAKRQAYNTPNSLPDSAPRPFRPLVMPHPSSAYSRPTAPLSPFRLPEHGANRAPNPLGPPVNPRSRQSMDGGYRPPYPFPDYRSP